MGKKEFINRIRNKTIIFFLIYSLIILSINFYLSITDYLENRIKLNYEIHTFDENAGVDVGLYHQNYGSDVLKSLLVINFFRNYFTAYTTFFLMFFAFIFNKNDQLLAVKHRVKFSEIVVPSIILLLLITTLFFLGREFIVPSSRRTLDNAINRSSQARALFNKGCASQKDGLFEEALNYYKEYLEIITDDNTIVERVAVLLTEVNIASFEKTRAGDLPQRIGLEHFNNSLLNKLESNEDKAFLTSIYSLDNYGRNYLLKDNLRSDEREKLWRILFIAGFTREILQVTSLEDTGVSGVITDYYQLAEIYFKKGDYTTAWYYYRYIFDNDQLRRDEVGLKISEIKNILQMNTVVSGQNSISRDSFRRELLEQERQMVHIYELSRKADYLYKEGALKEAYFTLEEILQINYRLREIRDFRDRVYAELTSKAVEFSKIDSIRGLPGKKSFCFMAKPNQFIYFGEIIPFSGTYYVFDVKIVDFDDNFNVTKTVTAPYGEFKNKQIFTMYTYSLNDRDLEFYPESEVSNGSKQTLKNDYIFTIEADISTLYNFSYDYERALDFAIFRLYEMRSFSGVSQGNETFSMGFNNNFIKTAIIDKISKDFMIFTLSLFMIVLGWKFRSKTGLQMGLRYYVLLPSIPLIFVAMINGFISINTHFYSILGTIMNFNLLLVVCIVLNVLLMVSAIVVVAGTGVDGKGQ